MAKVMSEPSGELMRNGPDFDAIVEQVVERLTRKPDRDAHGKFVRGTTSPNADTLIRSTQLRDALADAKAELVRRTRVSLGADDEDSAYSEPGLGLMDAHAETGLLRRSMFEQIARTGGAVSGKGRVRSLVTVYLGLVDRELRLATALGLTRRPKPAPSLDDLLDEMEARDENTSE